MEGIDDEEDGLHVAVHEMAHALKIDTVKGSPGKDRFPFYLNTWMNFATSCMRRSNPSTFIREYGRTNLHEFFAVCMENFVERPKDFYLEEPRLFAHTCYLLNQFPLEPKFRELNDSALRTLTKRTGVQFPKPGQKDFTHHSWHWSLSLLAFSIFFSPFLIGFQAYDVELPVNWFWCWMICTAIAGVVFYRPVLKYKVMEANIYVLFLIFGGGPMLFAGGLFVDAQIPVYTWTETHKVEEVNYKLREPGIYITLENNALREWTEVLSFPILGGAIMDHREQPMELHVKFTRGLFGVKHFKGHKLVFKPDYEDEIEL
jgi:hypothetical protein